jgi:hypothetical protein
MVNVRRREGLPMSLFSDLFEFLEWRKTAMPRLVFRRIRIINEELKLKGDLSVITITNAQMFALQAQGVDRKGKPAKIDGSIIFTSSDESLLTVTPGDDGVSAVITAVGDLGVAQIVAKGDADLSGGTVEVMGILDVEIVASQAVNIVISPGAIEEQ